MQLLFSYGTLQLESVQLATFSRRLVGVADRLPAYRLTRVPIVDPQRAAVHGTSHYANVVPAETSTDEVSGTLLEINDEELGLVDDYERLDGYSRIRVILASGARAWMYACDASPSACRSSDASTSRPPTEEITMATGTVRLHRVLRAPPERIYRAFLNADAMAKWLPPNGFTGAVHHMDARVGGTFRMSFTNFTTQQSHAFGGEYLELVPNERICYTDKFEDPNLPGVMKATILLKAVPAGTDLTVTQEGIPEVIPLEACYLGWQESLGLLAKLVEAEIRE